MLVGKELEIIAVPIKQLFNKEGLNLDPLLSLGDLPLVHDSTDIRISVERIKIEYLAARGLRHDPLGDYNNCVCFRLRFTKSVISYYLDRVYNHWSQKHPTLGRLRGEAKGIIFMGILVREFRDLICLSMVLSNIAEYWSFPIAKLHSLQFGREMPFDQMSMPFLGNQGNDAEKLGMQSLSLPQMLNFVRGDGSQIAGVPTNPLMKALANYSYAFSQGRQREALTTLLWSLASVEALLNPSGRSVRAQIEERLKVLFQGNDAGHILKKFKELYQYRSEMLHGSIEIPFSFNDRSEMDYKFVDPMRHASFASVLACRLMQICFEGQRTELKFSLQLNN